MTGRILGYNSNDNTGIISADNGERYKFTNEDWKENSTPQKEMKVDFEGREQNAAKDIMWLATDCPEYINGITIDINNTFYAR